MPRAANPTLREDILNAALQIVEEKSTAGLTMRAVAGALGYSATAIYQHFKSKEELLLALKIKAGDLLSQEMERARQEPTLEEQLFQMGRRYIRFGLENPTYYQLIFQDTHLDPSCSPEQTKRMRHSWSIMRGTMQTWVEEHGFQGIDIDQEANVLWIMVHGLTSIALAGLLASAHPEDVFALFDLSGSRWMAGLLSTQPYQTQASPKARRSPKRTPSRKTARLQPRRRKVQ